METHIFSFFLTLLQMAGLVWSIGGGALLPTAVAYTKSFVNNTLYDIYDRF